MSDIKPLSTFGIVDQLCSNELQAHYKETYDGLQDDMKRDFNRFMLDHFIDVEIIRNGTAGQATETAGVSESTPSAGMNGGINTVLR